MEHGCWARPQAKPRILIMSKKKITHTVRYFALKEANNVCSAEGITLCLTPHFIDRVNLRSPDQDKTFLDFTRAFMFVFRNRVKFQAQLGQESQRICVACGNEYFLFGVAEKQIDVLTYFKNEVNHT